MYTVEFYEDVSGKSDVRDYIEHLVKKSQKTPKKEIETAIRNIKDWIERNGD